MFKYMTLHELGKRLRHLARLAHKRDEPEIEAIMQELKRRDEETRTIQALQRIKI